MTAATLMIPGLDEIVRGNDPKRRADAARRIADLFLQGASHFRTEHVDLFDGVLVSLVPDTEILARADLAERLSQLANAPRALVGQLAREDEILIAGPLLRRSPVIDEGALIEIARMKGQGQFSKIGIDYRFEYVLTGRDGMVVRMDRYRDRAEALKAVGLAG